MDYSICMFNLMFNLILQSAPKKEDAFDGKGDLRIDRMLEFISEPYREYMEAPESFKSKYPAFYELMKEALEDE